MDSLIGAFWRNRFLTGAARIVGAARVGAAPAALAPAALALAALLAAHPAHGQQPGSTPPAGAAARDGRAEQAPIDLKLPRPAFKGTPKNAPAGSNLEAPRKGPRPAFMAPKGVRCVSAGKPVTSSDREPIVGSLSLVTDGDKEANSGSYVELGPRLQWVQIDLKEPQVLHAVVLWHYHASARIYHDVVVQVADDADFVTNVRTLFNNDHDNSSGLGLGSDKEFWETYEGKLIAVDGVTARYVRLYSNGSTADDMNHYTEVEVFGLPGK
jgi:hypothetical protein